MHMIFATKMCHIETYVGFKIYVAEVLTDESMSTKTLDLSLDYKKSIPAKICTLVE